MNESLKQSAQNVIDVVNEFYDEGFEVLAEQSEDGIFSGLDAADPKVIATKRHFVENYVNVCERILIDGAADLLANQDDFESLDDDEFNPEDEYEEEQEAAFDSEGYDYHDGNPDEPYYIGDEAAEEDDEDEDDEDLSLDSVPSRRVEEDIISWTSTEGYDPHREILREPN